MKIAVCDKNSNRLNALRVMIYEYAAQKRLDLVVECYLSGEEMLVSKTRYNIIFLAFDLLGEDGLCIAKRVRNQSAFSDIVFISEYKEFLFETVRVNPYGFLVATAKREEVFSFFNEYFKMNGCNFPFWLKSGGDTLCLNTREIVYLEADNKHCLVHLEDDMLRSNCTMAKVYEILPKSQFIKINRAYIVNSQYINRYNKDTVFLKNGDNLRLSRNYSADFKRAHRSFINPLEP